MDSPTKAIAVLTTLPQTQLPHPSTVANGSLEKPNGTDIPKMMKQETCSTINGGGGAGAWVCEACERAPAAFLCRADSASLCAACDADVHSANPLASRHHRVPISRCLRDPSSVGAGPTDDELFPDEDGDDDAASWLLLNPIKNDDPKLRSVDGTFIGCGGGGGEVDEYLDLGEFNQFGDNEDEFNFDHKHQNYGMEFDDEKSCGGDSVVPVNQGRTYKEPMQPPVNFQLGMDYECSETGYDYSASFSHSVSSVTSLDVGVVPESTAMGAVSQCRSGKGTIDLFSGPPPMIQVAAAAQQLSGAEREARVLRYREKKKARKFEKTIRYASRKAYAESRPRIKGRFAKRNDAVHVSDHHRMFSAAAAAGVAPSF